MSGDDLIQDLTRRLEESIVFGRLQPRERLIEEDLAQQFGVKRHVVRQALVGLEHLGLVERVRNRGAVVKLYEIREVEDINAVRELLEGHAASLIPLPLPEQDLARLRTLQQRHADAIDSGHRREVFRANILFHEALFAHCGNAALIEAIKTFAQKSHAYRSIFVNDRAYLLWAAGAHREMIEAIESSDRERLVRLCRDHLAPAKDRYIETLRARFV
ncbi:GntR family transcriptional regulator [uncultured Paracoccus sp.]|uniref:GntR family transcriptional regulator n=1 Tax=uncultured Paracoccus sp. TaxID=189685 RepID=UPI002630722F|nr:GntR family transcriptional regulator [uncultured Paracoccus sp.]